MQVQPCARSSVGVSALGRCKTQTGAQWYSPRSPLSACTLYGSHWGQKEATRLQQQSCVTVLVSPRLKSCAQFP